MEGIHLPLCTSQSVSLASLLRKENVIQRQVCQEFSQSASLRFVPLQKAVTGQLTIVLSLQPDPIFTDSFTCKFLLRVKEDITIDLHRGGNAHKHTVHFLPHRSCHD